MRTRWYGVISCLAVLFLATGCFQQAGSQSQVTAISQALPTFTPIPASDTPLPPATDTPTEEPTERALPPASPTSKAVATEAGTGGSVVQVTSPVVTLPVGTQIAQADVPQQEEDPLNITATAIIQRATQTQAANLTATAFALFGTPVPTLGPTNTLPPGVPPTATAAPVVPGANCVHEVRAGENLFRISLQYGVTINDIAQASGIVNPNIILVGQPLTIPGCGTTGVRPPATSTPQATTLPGTTNPPPTTGGTTYTVQQGETLFQISLRFGVPVNSIAAANGITNINLIYIGQQLVIPAA